MSGNVTGVQKPFGFGCWAMVRQRTGSLFAQSAQCRVKARYGKLTCRHHARLEARAQAIKRFK